MHRTLMLGVGLTGLLAGTAFGQPRPVASGFQPASAYSPPIGGVNPTASPPAAGFTPAPSLTPQQSPTLDIPLAVPLNHPWLLKPETGAWFISVKSYSRPAQDDPSDPGPKAIELAQALASDIRQTYKVGAWLFEYISEEKRAHAEAKAKAIQQAQAFANGLRQFQQKSDLQGMQFLDRDSDRVKIYYKTFRYRDQIAVLIGPWETEKAANEAAAIVRTKWPGPNDTRLMDGGAIVRPEGKGKVIERSWLNPYQQAMVVSNPAIHKGPQQVERLDPFIIKLNEGRPYNLLMAQKNWTLAVKSFGAPIQIQSKSGDNTVTNKIGSSDGADVLAAGADQAEQLAKALREMKGPAGQALRLEAFVLHTRSSSVVTVGQFDGPNDPALLEMRRILMGLTFNVGKDAAGAMGSTQRLFGDAILPIPVPRP